MDISTCNEKQHTLTSQCAHQNNEVVRIGIKNMADSHSEKILLVNKSAVRFLQYSPAGKPKKACQQAINTAMHYRHQLSGEPSTGTVSRLETQQSTPATHQLESQEQALSASQKQSKALEPLTPWRVKERHYQHVGNRACTTATHSLESQGQALSAGQKHSKAPKPLTNWRTKVGIVSRLETQQGTTVTHFLKSQGQTLSAS